MLNLEIRKKRYRITTGNKHLVIEIDKEKGKILSENSYSTMKIQLVFKQ